MADVVVNIKKNGPLFVAGTIQLVDSDGKPFRLPEGKPGVAFCRCGQSKNKPFCDGAHKAIPFDSDPKAV